MATNDDPSANDNPAASGGGALGGNQGKFAGNRNVSAGGGNINDYGGVHGNVINNNFFGPGAGNSNASSGEQPSGTSPLPLNTTILNQKLKNDLDIQSMKAICNDIRNSVTTYRLDLSYEELDGNGPMSKTLSLIDYCTRRRLLTAMIEAVKAERPDLMDGDYAAWHAWAAAQDARLQE